MNPTDLHTETYYRSTGKDNGGELKAGKEKAGKRSGSARLVLTSLSNTRLRNKLLQEPFHENISPETLIVTKTSRETLIVKNDTNKRRGIASSKNVGARHE